MLKDTITAISTPLGWGGIGIIRISGKDAFKIIKKVFKPVKVNKTEDIKSQTIKYGYIINPQTKELIDEVLVSYFKKPYTYTRENLAEINCHGGPLVVKRILEIVVKNGARIAEPGEFTKRAFLNGRIDLSQAEAVIEMINSKTDSAMKASLNQLEGKLSLKIKSIRNIIIESIADIEAAIDYPEYDIEEISSNKLLKRMRLCLEEIERLTKTFFEGKIIREGLKVAIVGKPNVGKSSLLNALVQKEKAIITEIPGTTRDVIEEFIQVDGIAINLLDTAGLRETTDYVEKIGIDRTKTAINKSDLTLVVLDASDELEEEDIEIFKFIKNKKSMVIINKTDLQLKLDIKEIKEYFKNKKIIEISAKQEKGLEKIKDSIKEMFSKEKLDFQNEHIIMNLRHKQILEEVKVEIESIIKEIKNKVPIDIISVSITQVGNKLGEITGETVNEEVMHTIFEKFCVGK